LKPREAFKPPDVPEEYSAFTGRVVEVQADDDSAGAAYEELFSRARFEAAFPEAAARGLPRVVGLDLEWKPDRWRLRDTGRGPGNPVALMQLSCWDAVLLVRTVGCNTLPPWLSEFLEDSSIIKVSASFDLSDKEKLRHSFGWKFSDSVKDPSTFLDIADLAKERGIHPGMKRMAQELGVPMLKAKHTSMSNWATEGDLSGPQRQYAAEDAFFTLYLLGLIFDRKAPEGEGTNAVKAYEAVKATKLAMAGQLKQVDNRLYKKCFFELRDVVKDGVASLSNALGSDGATTITNLHKIKAVEKVHTSIKKKGCALTLSAGFLKSNEDLFVTFWDHAAGVLKVRPRKFDDEEDGYDDEAEEEMDFVGRLLDRLAAYEPPGEKRQSVLNRHVPEALKVPARAILSAKEQSRWKGCAERHKDLVETSHSDSDGMIFRLLRHPRAPDEAEYMKRCVDSLQAAAPDIGAATAEAKLREDEKFMLFWQTLRTTETGTPEEAAIDRSLRARVRILGDAHTISKRVSTTWEAAREGLEKVKWYRQLLGGSMMDASATGEQAEAAAKELAECIDRIVKVWPDVKSIAKPQKRQGEGGGEPAAKRQKGDGRDKNSGRGRGKGKGKGKGKC